MTTEQELIKFYRSREFNREYIYDGRDLGAICSSEQTAVKLWSPVADRVILHLYREGDGGVPYASVPMEKGKCGVWLYEAKESLHGVYYDFDVTVCEKTRRTYDPYARAAGVNGLRSMIVDLSLTDPEGWEEDQAPEKTAEDIIYELHVKEYSWDKSAGFPEWRRGKYTAFSVEDTTLNGDGVHPTGMKYMKELGITHIQLMPVFDYGSVDEAGADGQFNWGYDPVNYNVPEGSYSSDPFHGEVRIKELKEAVAALHRNGFRVIMDVVYNHTYSLDSCFQKTVPWYYYRRYQDGRVSEGSCCGNDFASERAMAARYILDSVLYWAEEYHMDGFRFDLMGLLDTGLMNRIQEELDLQFGSGEKLIYGEPWAGTETAMEKGFTQALKENERLLNTRIGMFCDNTRDAVKGHVFHGGIPGFVNGGTGFEKDILHAASAWCDGGEFSPKSPGRILTYVSAHDNFTLWDKLILTMGPEAAGEAAVETTAEVTREAAAEATAEVTREVVAEVTREVAAETTVETAGEVGFHERNEDVLKAYRLAAAIYFTCQGRLFLLSGEEFARTKEGIGDSYCSPIEINRLDYGRAYEYEDLVDYYKGLAGLRKCLPGLCDKSENAVRRIFRKRIEGEGVVSFCVHNGGRWNTVFVAYNSRKCEAALELPAGEWSWLLRDGDSSLWRQPEKNGKPGKPESGRITLAPVSAAVLGMKESMKENVMENGGGENEV